MQILRSIKEVRNFLQPFRQEGKVISFVPTMGFLHEGHLSLVRYAKQNSDICCVSIFVNPTQFAPNEDFNRYPRDEQRDVAFLEKENCDLAFIPSSVEMYGENYKTYVNVRDYSKILEGEFRPTHFEGVTTVVLKLFNIVQPDFAVFGQKDCQQAFIIQKMVEDLNLPIKIEVLPIAREADGLAMSSRNIYLNNQERKDAVLLYKSLLLAKELVENSQLESSFVIRKVKEKISESELALIDYVEIVDAKTFQRIDFIKPGLSYLLLAVRFGKTRLIDNILL
ncbi:MAG: pantoate--beta-alanine ligase [Ignavibacteria bacterium]|nr:pantoate--beta-alanine ligase [Ignavibacteria bacterium]